MEQPLGRHAALEQTANHIHLAFNTPRQILSSAVLNGGMVEASHIVNLKVPKHASASELPEYTLSKYCEQANWHGRHVGMMTAASMDSLRMVQESIQGIDLIVLVTSGLSNPRRAGDHAEHRLMAAQSEPIGTINIIVLTSALLTDAAMVEALLIITEAKAAVLEDAGIFSPVSNKIATGTGTDSVAMVNGQGPHTVRYCGKHVLFGEVLGRMVSEAVASSIDWDRANLTTA